VIIKSTSCPLVYFLLKREWDDPDGADGKKTVMAIPCRGVFLDA